MNTGGCLIMKYVRSDNSSTIYWRAGESLWRGTFFVLESSRERRADVAPFFLSNEGVGGSKTRSPAITLHCPRREFISASEGTFSEDRSALPVFLTFPNS